MYGQVCMHDNNTSEGGSGFRFGMLCIAIESTPGAWAWKPGAGALQKQVLMDFQGHVRYFHDVEVGSGRHLRLGLSALMMRSSQDVMLH